VRVRLKDKPEVTGTSSKFNGSFEVLVTFEGGEMDSVFTSDLEVLIGGEWKDLGLSLDKKDIITDNHNTEFFEPQDEAEKLRGYKL
jgi:hypothetical protein